MGWAAAHAPHEGFSRFGGPPFQPFNNVDANNDGKITKDELLARFAKVDANKDGAITRQELFASFAASSAGKPSDSKESKADQPAAERRHGMMPGFGRMRQGGPRGTADRPRRPEGEQPKKDSKSAQPADSNQKQPKQPKSEKKEPDQPKPDQPKEPVKGVEPAAAETPKQTSNETSNETSPETTPKAEQKTEGKGPVSAEKPATASTAGTDPTSNN